MTRNIINHSATNQRQRIVKFCPKKKGKGILIIQDCKILLDGVVFDLSDLSKFAYAEIKGNLFDGGQEINSPDSMVVR